MQGGRRPIRECVCLDANEFEKVTLGEQRPYRSVAAWTSARSGREAGGRTQLWCQGQMSEIEMMVNWNTMKTWSTEMLLTPRDRTVHHADVLTFGPFNSVLLPVRLLKVKRRPTSLPWFSELKARTKRMIPTLV